MNTGHKISLAYSAITIGLVLVASLALIFLSSRYTRSLYFHYLAEKTEMVAMERFEQDELDSLVYQSIVQQRQQAIPTAREVFINMANRDSADHELATYLNAQQMEELHEGEIVNFTHGNEVGSAMIYDDNEGRFAVVLLSRNPYGEEIASNIGWGLALFILCAALILFLFSRVYATRMVNRIDQDYQTEKLFVNNASHEINNPLTAIRGECEIALMSPQSAEGYRQSIERIATQTDRVIDIIQQLLYFSHNDVSREECEPIAIGAFCQQFADQQTQVVVVSEFAVRANEDLLRMAIGNIVSNARKYSNGQPVVLRVLHKRIEIEDHGIGIPEADLPHIFDPFFRASNTGSTAGNGIGLALARNLLQKQGATVTVKNTGSTGTIFEICF